jgi:hypothetical protein
MMPSIVVISAPATALTGTTHERIASPFWCAVQAPQSTAPQPNFVPVRPRISRRYQSTGISGSPANERSTPFTLNSIKTRHIRPHLGKPYLPKPVRNVRIRILALLKMAPEVPFSASRISVDIYRTAFLANFRFAILA